MLNTKIEILKREFIRYATLVESMIVKSIDGLLLKESRFLEDVIENDELAAEWVWNKTWWNVYKYPCSI